MEILNQLSHYDQRIFLWLASTSRSSSYARALYICARTLSRTGDGYLQVIVPLAILALWGADAYEFFIVVLLAFGLERCSYLLLKNSLKRRRPPVAIPHYKAAIIASDEFSFPSGHTSAAFLLAILVAGFIPYLAIPMFIWASLVGVSRVILGVHFPADILAGCLLALTVSTFITSL